MGFGENGQEKCEKSAMKEPCLEQRATLAERSVESGVLRREIRATIQRPRRNADANSQCRHHPEKLTPNRIPAPTHNVDMNPAIPPPKTECRQPREGQVETRTDGHLSVHASVLSTVHAPLCMCQHAWPMPESSALASTTPGHTRMHLTPPKQARTAFRSPVAVALEDG